MHKLFSQYRSGNVALLVIAAVAIFLLGGLVGYQGVQYRGRSVPRTASLPPIPLPASSSIPVTPQVTPTAILQVEPPFIEEGTLTWSILQPIPSLGVFLEEDKEKKEGETKTSYYRVGSFRGGKYNGGELILVARVYYGLGQYLDPYRFVKLGNQLTLLTRHSSSFFEEKNADRFLNRSRFDLDRTYEISALRNPPVIVVAPPSQILSFASQASELFTTTKRRIVFTHPTLGPIWTTAFDGENGFYVRAPDGTEWIYQYVIPFQDGKTRILQLTWRDGTENTSPYVFTTPGGCGSRDLAHVVDQSKVTASDLTVIGTTPNHGPVYGLKNSRHLIITKLYEQYIGLVEAWQGQDSPPQKLSYEQFLAVHPVFFWVDPFGRLLQFEKEIIAPLAECGKPVIYLYPPQTTRVSVKIEPKGGMTYSEPKYGDGWDVLASPQSELVEIKSGATYPYLFWEGRGGLYTQPKRGWVVAENDVRQFLISKLASLGLNKKETHDFLEFWEPRMKGTPYYFITFLGTRAMNEIAPLVIIPKPDTTIRILMDFSPLQKPIEVTGFEIKPPVRKGFSVIEWGGVIR